MVRFAGAGVSIGATPVTVGQYRAFVNATGYRTGSSCRVHFQNWAETPGYDWSSPGYRVTLDHPVTCVTQRDAMAYVSWLRRETGERYDLPNVDLWERMARNVTPQAAAVCLDCATRGNSVMPVGSAGYVSGLADVLGNVWQWTSTCAGSDCALRGGAWETEAAALKSREFRRSAQGFRTNALGFRVIRYD